jgi:TorA maturation chaperone TorD
MKFGRRPEETGEAMPPHHATTSVAEEELVRAHLYGLLASLLAAPPSRNALDLLKGLRGDDSPLGEALGALADGARALSPNEIEAEFNALFIGVTAGELIPYGSWFLTGFLNEKPLAALRADMARLGLAAAEDLAEPEDHIAALCEMMQGLIDGRFGAPLPLAGQEAFFTAHLAPWAGRFFADLERAASAQFYRPVGSIGRLYMEIEAQAFAMGR